jgi:hypothetical protein
MGLAPEQLGGDLPPEAPPADGLRQEPAGMKLLRRAGLPQAFPGGDRRWNQRGQDA